MARTDSTGEKTAHWWSRRDHPLVTTLLLGLILLAGLLLRFEDAAEWHKHANRSLSPAGEYYSTTYDGYYYLNIARDLVEGNAGASEWLKGVPDITDHKTRRPLLSVLIAQGTSITGLSVNQFGAMLIPVLGVLVALPVYFLGQLFAGRVMGLSAALFTLTVPYLHYRSALGWIDTDALNAFFAMLAALLFARFGLDQTLRRYLYLGYGMVCYLVFLWWWDMAPAPVTLITFLPLLVVLAFHYRAPRREWIWLAGGLGVAVVVGLIVSDPGHYLERGLDKLRYVSKQQGGDFPNIGVSISEQAIPGIADVIRNITTQGYVLLLAVIGLIWLLIVRHTLALVIAAPLLLSALSFLFAERFMIFLAPLAGLGIGFLVQRLWEMRPKTLAPVLVRTGALLVLLVALLPNVIASWKGTRTPKPPTPFIAVLENIRDASPPDSLIWAWWDYGYPIQFWARRATLADGAYHPGEGMVHLAYPLTVSSPRLAANYMQFYAVRGTNGIRELYKTQQGDKAEALEIMRKMLDQGPETAAKLLQTGILKGDRNQAEWLEFFYPPTANLRPVYLLLSRDMLRKAYWWFWFGSWNVNTQQGVHPDTTLVLRNLREQGKWITDGRSFKLDTETGQGEYRGKYFIVHWFSQFAKGRYDVKNYRTNARNAGLTWYKEAGVAMLYDANLADSVYGRLYLASGSPENYFKPVIYQPGGSQLWKVEADHLKSEKTAGTESRQ